MMKWIANFPATIWFKGLILSLVFAAGCTVTTWYWSSEVKDLKLAQSSAQIANLTTAAATLEAAADSVNKAAKAVKTNSGDTNARLDTISKQIKGFSPLPADCKPDANRVRVLREAIDASNGSTAR
jgi:outer membrane murein-binding lipoprotein Lpp